jgi:adenosylcobyric acid synthase
VGVIINKFRGDRQFFTEGEKIIRERFGVPVLGVLPYQPLNIDMEDSQSLQNYEQRLDKVKVRVAVIAYPGMSNYNDLDVLMADPEVEVTLLRTCRSLFGFDMVLLPGSKTVIRDLHWLREQGWFVEIQNFKGAVFGLCGGYQMLCKQLCDPDAIEHELASELDGLGFIDDTVVYQLPKILCRGEYDLFACVGLTGYEIHCGRMAKYPLFYQQDNIAGTHVHGVFDNDSFRTLYFRAIAADYQGYAYLSYRESEIQGFADMVAENLDVAAIFKALKDD